MRFAIISSFIAVAGFLAPGSAAGESELSAKKLFSQVPGPAPLAARTIGFYSRGCVAGAVALPVDGPEWQAMRLSRNRNWGMPQLVAYIEKLARDAKALDGWPGILVGDLGQPRGGPAPFGHASHQSGLDVDIWFEPMPERRLSDDEREDMVMASILEPGTQYELDMDKWPEGLDRLIERAAGYPEVARIFVNPGVKKLLCDRAGDDRAWLSKVRPWYKHDDHFHVRLSCPPDADACRGQDPPPPGDGCDESLDFWLDPARYKQAPEPKEPPPPPREIMMSDLPVACREVIASGDTGLLDPPPPPLPRMRPASLN
jgi:penicillin-insensitive murein DD-endopeptidase